MKKYLKIGPYGATALAILVFSFLLRVTLAAFNWPVTTSDEGSMGLMAIHIAYRGELPLVLYGQTYMGSLEAFLGSVFFHLFGISLFSLRLGVILLFILFLASMYLLTCLLFSKKLALVTLALLALGSDQVLSHEIIATGGSTQTLLFGSLAFLVASWLVLSFHRSLRLRVLVWRYLAYLALGLVVGLGLWSDMIVVPFFAMAGLLLVLFCWRELFSPAPLFLLGGLILGLIPLLDFNFVVLHGTNSAAVLLGLFQGSSSPTMHTLPQILHNVQSTVQVSLPMATGEPFCPVIEWPWIGDSSSRTPACAIAHGLWGGGYLLLLLVAILLTASIIWQLRRKTSVQASPEDVEQQQVHKRFVIQLVMLSGAAVDIIFYVLSSAPVSLPGIHSRYLIGLLIITPAILDPLWNGASAISRSPAWAERTKTVACRCMLALIFVAFLSGTLFTFSQVASAQSAYGQEEALIHDLERVGVTHMYTEYWTCNRLAFLSNEQITCAVIDNNLKVDMYYSRYKPYIPLVENDPHAAYVSPLNLPVANAMRANLERKASQPGAHYRRYIFDGYLVLQPSS
jgi:hypothetical protein